LRVWMRSSWPRHERRMGHCRTSHSCT